MTNHKKQRLIIIALLAAFLVVCLIVVLVYNHAAAPFRDLPPVAFNFPLSKQETRYSDSSHVYEYDLTTKRVTPHYIEGLDWLDADMAAKLVLGRMGETIVELDLTNDSIRELGPASYQNQPLEFVRWRPGSEDYCGITKDGKLVLWRQADQEFVLLKTMTWNGYSFGCSWSGDGKRLFIPDEAGIAYFDVDTKEERHWLTLSIPYPEYWSYSSSATNKLAFSVSPDQSTVVYGTAERKLMLVQISEDGRINNEMELCEFDNDCAFSISDNNSVVFVRTKVKPFLFTHTTYEISLYRDGSFRRLKKTDWSNNVFSGTYVFW